MDKQETVKTRYQYIDRAKAIAIMGVVFLHVVMYCFDDFRTDRSYATLCSFLHLYQQPLFMFLSGLVVSTKFLTRAELPKEIYKKFRTIMVPFLVIGLALTYSINKNAFDFITSDPKQGYWYLYVLFVMYLTHYLYKLLFGKKNNSILRDIIWGGIIAGILITGKMTATPLICGILSLTYLTWLYPFFWLGIVIKKYNLHDFVFKNDRTYSICIFIVLTYIFLYAIGLRLPLQIALYVFAFALIPVVMSILSTYEDKENWFLRQLDFIGRNTLDVYVFHFFFLYMMVCPWVGEWAIRNFHPLVEFTVGIVPTILITYLAIGLGQAIRKSKRISKLLFYK